MSNDHDQGEVPDLRGFPEPPFKPKEWLETGLKILGDKASNMDSCCIETAGEVGAELQQAREERREARKQYGTALDDWWKEVAGLKTKLQQARERVAELETQNKRLLNVASGDIVQIMKERAQYAIERDDARAKVDQLRELVREVLRHVDFVYLPELQQRLNEIMGEEE